MLNTAMKLTNKRAEYVLPATTVELARAYRDRHAQNQAKLSKICREHQILFATLPTTDDAFFGVQRLLAGTI
ncbi:MAG: hypothetical protein EXR86_16035 [Gammaproteobacteria bacterium]|nr:hypothetical protein [Gammaproteobacteria bacterium]